MNKKNDYNEKASKEFDQLLEELGDIKDEVQVLENITRFTECIEKKLLKLYDQSFPKKCNTCGRIYNTRNDYIKATQKIKKSNVIYNEDGVQEYRNCVCGSTLLVITDDRRDNSEFGTARRNLFDICVNKLVILTKEDKETVQKRVRKIFRKIIQETQIKGRPGEKK